MLRHSCQICFSLWLALIAALAVADDAADQFAVANAHYSAERWQLAIEEFQAFLDRHGDHEKADIARYYLAESLLQSDRLQEARKAFTKLAVDKPQSKLQLAALFRLGESEFFLNEAEPAQKRLEAYLAIAETADDEHRFHAQSYLAELDLHSKQFKRAAERFQLAAKASDPSLAAECQFGLARALEGAGDMQAALKIYHSLAADAYGPLADRALLQSGTLHNGAGDYAAALADFDRFMANHADSKLLPEARLARGWSLYKLERYADAHEDLAKAAESSALAGEARYWIARAHMAQADWAAALDALATAARSARPEMAAAIAFHEGEAFRQLERWDEATARFDGVLGNDAGREYFDDATFGKLQIAIKRQQHAEAVRLASHFLDSFAESPMNVAAECRSTLAVCQARLGQFAQAEEALAKLIAEHPDSELIAATTYNVAEAAFKADKPELARKLFGQLTTEGNPDVWKTRGLAGIAWCQLKSDDLSASANTFERLLKDHPGDPLAGGAALLRGQALERLGQLDVALAMYHRVLADYPTSRELPQAMFRAALLHDKLNQDTDAATLYQKLLADYPDFTERSRVLYQFGCLQADGGNAKEAETLWQSVRTAHSDSEVRDNATYRLAAAALEARQFAACRALLDDFTKHPADDALRPYVLFLDGRLAAAQEDWKAVVAPLEKLVKEFPDHELAPTANFWLGESVYRLGDYRLAADKFAQLALTLQTGPFAPLCRLRHAQSLAQLDQWSDALAVANGIAKEYPQFESQYEADYLIGRALANQADFKAAREAYERVVRSALGGKTETAAMAQFMSGESYFHQEDFAAAERAYLRVEILYAFPKWQAAALLQAGKCQEQLGQWKEASETYSRLLATYRDSDVADEAAKRLGLAQQHTKQATR